MPQILDWVCATTSLDLMMWLKFDSIWTTLYRNTSQQAYRVRDKDVRAGLVASASSIAGADALARSINPLQVLSGENPQPKQTKFLSGVLLFTGLVIVLVGPMLLFSTLNPTLTPNPISSSVVSFGMFAPIPLPAVSIPHTHTVTCPQQPQSCKASTAGEASAALEAPSCCSSPTSTWTSPTCRLPTLSGCKTSKPWLCEPTNSR